MELKDLEKQLNNIIKEKNYENEYFYYSQCQDIIKKEIKKIFEDNGIDKREKDIYFSLSEFGNANEKGNVYYCCYENYRRNSSNHIIFKIRRRKLGRKTDKQNWYNHTIYYGIKSIEIIADENIKTIEDFIKYNIDLIGQNKQKINNEVESFNNLLSSYNLSIEDFKKIKDRFDTLKYESKEKIIKNMANFD